MINQLLIAAIFTATFAFAEEVDHGLCNDPDYQCTLYSKIDFQGDHYTFCLPQNVWGERFQNIGYSFLSTQTYSDFPDMSLTSFQCGAKVKADFCLGRINTEFNTQELRADWTCSSTIYSTDGFGEGLADLGEVDNRANGLVISSALPDLSSSDFVLHCTTTLFENSGCNHGYEFGYMKHELPTAIEEPSTDLLGFSVGSILLEEFSLIRLYKEPDFMGNAITASNLIAQTAGEDNCICI